MGIKETSKFISLILRHKREETRSALEKQYIKFAVDWSLSLEV